MLTAVCSSLHHNNIFFHFQLESDFSGDPLAPLIPCSPPSFHHVLASIHHHWLHPLLKKKKKREKITQSCPTLCDPMDCSLPGSSIHGIFQARILEWVAIFFSNQLLNWVIFSKCKSNHHFSSVIFYNYLIKSKTLRMPSKSL